jgi:hypothetical protein
MDRSRRHMIAGVSVGTVMAAAASAGAQTVQPRPYSVSVIDYGADPTATVDSTAAFLSAIAAASGGMTRGGVVLIPSGHYKLSSTIEVPQFVTISGPGTPDSAQLDFTSQTNGPGLRLKGYGHSAIEGFHIINPAGNGVELFNTNPTAPLNFCHLRDVWVSGARNGGSGFVAKNTYMTTFERCWAKSCAAFGFHLAGFHTSVKLDTCWADSCANTGFNINATVYSTLNNCGADTNGSYGYFLTNCEGVAMTGCGAEGNVYSAVAMAATNGWAANKLATEGNVRGVSISSFFSLSNNTALNSAFGAYLTLYTEDQRLIEGSSINHIARDAGGRAEVVKRGLSVAQYINFPVTQGGRALP